MNTMSLVILSAIMGCPRLLNTPTPLRLVNAFLTRRTFDLSSPSHLSNALPNTPTPLRLVNAFPTRRTFNLSSPSHQVDSRHPHSFPTQCSFNLSSSSRQVYSRCLIGLATAVGRSPIAYLPRLMHLSPSFLAPYIYVPLCSSVTSLATLRSFSMSHPQFPVSIYPCFIYLYSLPPPPLL